MPFFVWGRNGGFTLTFPYLSIMFEIVVLMDGKRYRIDVTPLGEVDGKDRYLLKGGKRERIIWNDRPLMKRHNVIRPIIWDIEGKTRNTYDERIYQVGKAIEKYMRENGHWD